jgi:twitching motility protein PilT
MSQILDRVLNAARQLGASDVHLKAGLPPIFRIKGELRTVRDVPALTREAIASFAVHMMNDRQRAEFEREVRHRHGLRHARWGALPREPVPAARLGRHGDAPHPTRGAPFETLNLPKTVLDLTENGRGVVLVTGATGSGKSTTLAAMIDYINQRNAYHIVTVEDPIEYTFRDKRSVINQREVGFDTMSVRAGPARGAAAGPDVILVGEMRDPETAQIAITAAETGPPGAVDAAHRRRHRDGQPHHLDVPAHQQAQARLRWRGRCAAWSRSACCRAPTARRWCRRSRSWSTPSACAR